MSDIAQDLGGVVLAACPFCGNDVNDDEGCFQAGGFLLPTTPHWVVRCGNPSCNAETSAVNPDDAIAAWNTRTHSAEIAGALRDADGWQPIESAPRDRPVIVTNGEAVGEARYLESDGGWWWAGYHPTDAADGYVWQPTHWRPLPAPPTQDSAMQQGGGGGE